MTEDEAAMLARLAVITTSATSRIESHNWPGHANRLRAHERRVREYYNQHPGDPEAAAYWRGVLREER